MNVCTHCGFRTPGGRFCAECGAPFAPVESAPDQQTQAPPLFPSTSRSQSVRSEPGFASTAGVLSAVPVDYGQPKDDHSACSQRSQSARSYRGDVDISAKVGHGGFAEQPERGRRGRSTGSSGSFALLKGRYADHPSCDVCDTPFDVTRRRHQWYVVLSIPALDHAVADTRCLTSTVRMAVARADGSSAERARRDACSSPRASRSTARVATTPPSRSACAFTACRFLRQSKTSLSLALRDLTS